jgi:TPR repeat protein
MHAVAAQRYFSGVVLLLLVVHAHSPAFARKQKHNDQAIFKQAQALEESSGGNAAAEFLLGDSYENGRGVPQDYAEALRWYLKSVNRDYAAAQVPLAWLYFGHPPPKCSADELQSLDKIMSAGQGTSDTIERWSSCKSNDDNLGEAYFWADVALASQQPEKDGGLSKDGRTRALLLKKMLEGGVLHGPMADRPTPALLSPEKIATAQARATKWFAAHQQNGRGR